MSIEQELLQAAEEVGIPIENETIRSIITLYSAELNKTFEELKQLLESGKFKHPKFSIWRNS